MRRPPRSKRAESRHAGAVPRLVACAGALLFGVAAFPSSAWAVSGNLHQLSDPVGGLRLTVGYRPLRVTVTPLRPDPAERNLYFEFFVRRNNARSEDLSVLQEIVVPAGSTRPAAATVAVPQHVDWWFYQWEIRENGRALPRLGMTWTPCNAGTPFGEWAESLPAVLVVGDTLPRDAAIGRNFPTSGYYQSSYQYGATTVSTSPSDQLPTMTALAAPELPERWIDYSGLDVVCARLDELTKLEKQRPRALRALLDWTAAGGNLWVFGAGDQWQRLADLEQLAELPPQGDGASPAQRGGWREPSGALRGQPVRGVLPGQEGMVVDQFGNELPVAEGVETRPEQAILPGIETAGPPHPGGKPPFRLRPYAMGRLVAFASEGDLLNGNADLWAWVFNEVGRDRWLWCQRHGLSTARENADFWNFLIPGVGLAPATEFCVLITLFVLAIGPLNYWLLRRWGRIHLLAVTIPLGAATVTLLLFVYAILADGLGTRVRVRSVTRIDQRRDRAVCWSRASYYAGLAPYGGLSFPRNVAVFPLEDLPPNHGVNRYQQSGLRQEMFWGENQHLRSGFLASRTPTQYFTVRSRESRRGLVLARPRGRPEVVNQLGTPLHQVLMCDKDGQLYWAERVPADGTAELSPINLADARSNLSRVHRAHEPALPEGMRQYRRGGMFGFSRRRYWGWASNSAMVPPSQSTSLMEKQLRLLTTPPAQGQADPLARPRSYVAVVEQSPEVPLGVSSAEEEESYHVVFGRW